MSPDPPRDQQLFDPQPPSSAQTPLSAHPPTSAQPPLTPPVDNSPFRRLLPWIVSAAAVLGLMLVMLFVVLPRVSQVPRPARNPPLPSSSAAVPPVEPATSSTSVPAIPSAQPPASAQSPLSVTLYSAGGGKHVPVGKPVLISAYAVLPPTGSATIAIAYTRNGGPRSLLTLAQGSLSTASWTPSAPGRYDFTASASDGRKISVFSHHIIIVADAPLAAVKPLPLPVVPPASLPVKAARVRPPRLKQPAPRHLAARPVPPQHLALKPQSQQAPPSKAYHVAAASFVVRPVAETLAGALRRRGFHAFVRVTTRPHRKPTYAVETGDYQRSSDAQKQAGILKRDGYPAFVFQGQ